jgi:hypothetical protein
MLNRVLDGLTEVLSSSNFMTYVPALNNMRALASLRESLGRAKDARHQKTFVQDHDKCKSLRNSLADSCHASTPHISDCKTFNVLAL